MVGFSCANAFSNLWVGGMVERWGVEAPFWVGSLGAMLLGALVLVFLPRPIRIGLTSPEGQRPARI